MDGTRTSALTNVSAWQMVAGAVADEVNGHVTFILTWHNFISLLDCLGSVKVPVHRPTGDTISRLPEQRSDMNWVIVDQSSAPQDDPRRNRADEEQHARDVKGHGVPVDGPGCRNSGAAAYGQSGGRKVDSETNQAAGASITAELCPPMPSDVFSVSAPGFRGVGPSSSRG